MSYNGRIERLLRDSVVSVPAGIWGTVERERLRSSGGAWDALSTGGFLHKEALSAFIMHGSLNATSGDGSSSNRLLLAVFHRAHATKMGCTSTPGPSNTEGAWECRLVPARLDLTHS